MKGYTAETMLTVWQAVVMGFLQGLTEFLPISSTAHLRLLPLLFGWSDPGLTFDVALHAGTLLAVLGYFLTTWLRIIRHETRLLGLLILTTIPGAIAGYLFEERADTTLRNPLIIAAALIVVGLLMGWADRAPAQTVPLERVGWSQVCSVGLAQATAVIPGVSRSGSTIAAGLVTGMTREAAARFSFLLSTPIILGAVLKKGWELHKTGIEQGMQAQFVAGIVVSAVVGALSIAFFLRYLRQHTLKPFVWYRIALGVFIIGMYVSGAIRG